MPVDAHPPDVPFRCDVEPDRDIVWVRPVRELDLATVPAVQDRLDQLRDAGFERLIVDLRQIAFIDSAGIRLAVAWHERSRREQFGFALVRGPKPVRRVFETSGLEDTRRFLETAERPVRITAAPGDRRRPLLRPTPALPAFVAARPRARPPAHALDRGSASRAPVPVPAAMRR